VAVRAEDGRRVAAVDVTPYIGRLPRGRDTVRFATDDASGSTSLAAAIQEALEVGADALLLDEDTAASNLLYRDAAMAALVADEPITPLSVRAGALRAAGVSVLMALGASSALLPLADCVIGMREYAAEDLTARAAAIAAGMPPPPPAAAAAGYSRSYGRVAARAPVSVHPGPSHLGRGGPRVRSHAMESISYGDAPPVDLRGMALQLADASQARGVAYALNFLHARVAAGGGRRPLAALLDDLEAALEAGGTDALAPGRFLGDLARPRRFEVAGALNRLRTLEAAQVGGAAM